VISTRESAAGSPGLPAAFFSFRAPSSRDLSFILRENAFKNRKQGVYYSASDANSLQIHRTKGDYHAGNR
jgi:hypothetical protein